MNNTYQIQYLTHNNIDKIKWDQCINQSPNGLIYGYSFYLDHMARHWDALVLNDYEAVMPLTWNKKLGIHYLYQPAFTQQLGVFARSGLSQELVQKFISIITSRFRFAEIFLNFQNPFTDSTLKTNFILSLNRQYQAICSGYRNDAIKNIRRSEKFQLRYMVMDDPLAAMLLYRNTYAQRTRHVKDTDYANFERLCTYTNEKKMLVVRKSIDENGTLQSLALLMQQKNRLYLLQSTTLPEGRQKEANYFLLDKIIQEFSNQDIILDFEGSDIPGIAHFYQNFGAANQPYYFYKHNNLRWPLRLLK
jgi:hypothetical protein